MMKGLPDALTYEQELVFWPYRWSIEAVIKHVCENAPKGGSLLDVMCGPGYLLEHVHAQRADLRLVGVDIDERYVHHAREKGLPARIVQADVMTWESKEQHDVVVCTGSLHHLAYEQQEPAVGRMGAMLKDDGFLIISDCFVDDYANEQQRKLAAARLGYEYLVATIRNKAPDAVIRPTIEVLDNDVFGVEFKTSLSKRLPAYEQHFREVTTFKTWPKAESEYGDYVSILRGKR